MVQIMAAIKRSTKTGNIESPPFYCQRPLLKLNSFHRRAICDVMVSNKHGGLWRAEKIFTPNGMSVYGLIVCGGR
jgi:hypothetical protein